jgi:hypothetical protein
VKQASRKPAISIAIVRPLSPSTSPPLTDPLQPFQAPFFVLFFFLPCTRARQAKELLRPAVMGLYTPAAGTCIRGGLLHARPDRYLFTYATVKNYGLGFALHSLHQLALSRFATHFPNIDNVNYLLSSMRITPKCKPLVFLL